MEVHILTQAWKWIILLFPFVKGLICNNDIVITDFNIRVQSDMFIEAAKKQIHVMCLAFRLRPHHSPQIS